MTPRTRTRMRREASSYRTAPRSSAQARHNPADAARCSARGRQAWGRRRERIETPRDHSPG
eukprot:9192407-Pyramimonas_sp.AAC.1